MRAFLALVLASLALVLGGCGGDEGRAGEEAAAVAGITETVAAPAFADLATDATALGERLDDFCADPGPATLDAARAAWREARLRWRATEPVWVGPVSERRSEAVIDWPPDRDRIAELRDGGEPIDAERLTRVAASQRGLATIELLIFGREPTPRACAYAAAAAAVAAEEARALAIDWGAGPMLDTGMLVTGQLSFLRAAADMRLAAAASATDTAARAEILGEGAAGQGAPELREGLVTLRATLVGGNGRPGLADLADDDLRVRLVGEVDAAIAALERPEPLAGRSPGELRAIADALRAVERTMATELVMALGVTVGFSDNDGDGG